MLTLDSVVTVDNTRGLTGMAEDSYNRPRAIRLVFDRLGDNGYSVHAWGSAFPENGSGAYRGKITKSHGTIASGVDMLLETWQRQVVQHQDIDPDTGRTIHPFVENWDMTTQQHCDHLRQVGLALAKAGHALFKLIFGEGDAGLRDIVERLVAALRSGEHLITMESEDLFVPWGMLYTPDTDDPDPLWTAEPTWSFDQFWGYRHVVEQTFSRVSDFDSRISLPDGRPVVGLNVDHRVDDQHPPTPYVQPVIDFFDQRAKIVVRNSRNDLAMAIQSPQFADQITYFGCHGNASGGDNQSYLTLGDGEKIYGAEFLAWLTDRHLPTRPLVFVGACRGGQLSSLFYPAFGRHLLSHGARCLVGPQVDLPRAFAREYTTCLFVEFLRPGERLGDIVRRVARRFADENHNPLGLIFSLYRGIDVHLWADDRAAP